MTILYPNLCVIMKCVINGLHCAFCQDSSVHNFRALQNINPENFHPCIECINKRPGPEVIKLFSCSTQLSTKFQLLIKAKIPTNKEISCFKSLRCCIYHANKC